MPPADAGGICIGPQRITAMRFIQNPQAGKGVEYCSRKQDRMHPEAIFQRKFNRKMIICCHQIALLTIYCNLLGLGAPAITVQRWKSMSGNYRRILSLLFPKAVLLNNSLINSKGNVLQPKQTLPHRPIANLPPMRGGKPLIFHCFQYISNISLSISCLQSHA